MSPSTGLANLPPASEFYKLGLLLSVSTAVNREDLYPTFTAHPEEKFLWREAKKLDNHSTITDEIINILVLDHQILAGMTAGRCALVVGNISSSPVINHESEVYPDALGLGHCEVRPDGVDYWAKIKTNENGRGKFLCDKWVFYIPDASHFQSANRPITLADHVTTLTAYLNDYRKMDDEHRSKMSSLFSDYITPPAGGRCIIG